MSLNLLDHFLITQLGAFLLIFCRVGAALMVMPGIGDSYVSPRFRLLFSMVMSVLLTPLLADRIPPLPASALGLGLILIFEVIIGAFIGMIARTIMSILHTAGTIIAYQSSLAVSSIFDPVTGAQTAVVSNFMTIIAMTAMFALNLHHLMLASIVESYNIFTPGAPLMAEDMFKFDLRLVGDCFAMGVLLSAPHIVFSFVFYLMGGLMTRLMPNFQIISIMMAPQIIIAFLLLAAIIPITTEIFTNYTQDQLEHFVGNF